MSTNHENDGMPEDPIGIGEELDAMLAAAAELDDSLLPPPLSEEEQRFEDRWSVWSDRVAAALIERGVNLELAPEQSLQTVEEPKDDAVFYRRNLINFVVGAIISAEDSSGEPTEAMEEALARITHGPLLTAEEKASYMNVVEALAGEDVFAATLSKLLSEPVGWLEWAAEDTARIEEKDQDTTRISVLLIALGLPFDHDDFAGFTHTLVRARILFDPERSRTPFAESLKSSLLDRLGQQAVRLGIIEDLPRILRMLGIWDDPS